MKTIKESLTDLGLQSKFKTMRTEELYRGPATMERLAVLLERARQVQEARKDIRSIFMLMVEYDSVQP